MEFTHKPVLLAECIEALHIRPEGIYVDGTLGRAGHSREIAQRLTTGRLVCIDRDQAAIDAAQERLAPWMDRVTLVHSNFSRLAEVLDDLHIDAVDGMLFDLGVSSPQLDDAARKVSLYERQYALSLSTWQLMVREFTAGRQSLTDVIQVERQMLDYKLKKSEAVAAYNTTVAAIEKLIAD